MPFTLTSSSFPSAGDIPRKFTCDGVDVSPELSWSNAPQGTKSFALIADDPDAPVGTWVHWVLYDLAPATDHLPEGVNKVAAPPSGGHQGRNDFHKTGYGGPCPPAGKPHRYFFKLYALDTLLNLGPDRTKADVEKAMQGHILAHAEYMGKYKR
jgi:Raf kinase inhibitor-like YbhB/YbcL family protein